MIVIHKFSTFNFTLKKYLYVLRKKHVLRINIIDNLFLFLLFFRRIVKNIFEEESEFVYGIVELYCKMHFTSIRKNKAV